MSQVLIPSSTRNLTQIDAGRDERSVDKAMLGRLFRQSFSPKSLFFGRIVIPKAQINPRPRLSQSFWTSSRVNQKYQYSRFGANPNSTSYFHNVWYRFTPVQRIFIVGVGGGAPLFYVTHLETVEPTGRRRFIFLSPSMEETLGKTVPP
jgi:hypothetical protein